MMLNQPELNCIYNFLNDLEPSGIPFNLNQSGKDRLIKKIFLIKKRICRESFFHLYFLFPWTKKNKKEKNVSH